MKELDVVINKFNPVKYAGGLEKFYIDYEDGIKKYGKLLSSMGNNITFAYENKILELQCIWYANRGVQVKRFKPGSSIYIEVVYDLEEAITELEIHIRIKS